MGTFVAPLRGLRWFGAGDRGFARSTPGYSSDAAPRRFGGQFDPRPFSDTQKRECTRHGSGGGHFAVEGAPCPRSSPGYGTKNARAGFGMGDGSASRQEGDRR